MASAKNKNNDSKKPSKVPPNNQVDQKELDTLKLENQVLVKNNKILAQKVADLEHSRIL